MSPKALGATRVSILFRNNPGDVVASIYFTRALGSPFERPRRLELSGPLQAQMTPAGKPKWMRTDRASAARLASQANLRLVPAFKVHCLRASHVRNEVGFGATLGGYTGKSGRAKSRNLRGFLEAALKWPRGRDSRPDCNIVVRNQ